MKSILFAADLVSHGRSYQRLRALRGLGHRVVPVATEVGLIPGVSRNPKLWTRFLFKLGIPADETGAGKEIVKNLERESFDILWIEKGLTLRPAVLRAARCLRPDIRIVNFSEDDMFARHNQSKYYREGLPLLDAVVSTKSYNCTSGELPALGARRVLFVDKTYDPHIHRPQILSTDEHSSLAADVGFIGTFERHRAEQMLFLASNGIAVRIWGNGWNAWRGRHPLMQVEARPLYGLDYVKALSATKINLCFLRKMNRDLQTDRSLEIPACGAFMLAERTPEHLRLFTEGIEAAYFDADRPSELLQKVRYYLAHEDERTLIAMAGLVRCETSPYRHSDALIKILDFLEPAVPCVA